MKKENTTPEVVEKTEIKTVAQPKPKKQSPKFVDKSYKLKREVAPIS